MINLKIFLSISFFSLSFLLLSYKLDQIPNGVYVDEATSGINAYSILKTGKDEYGKEFPVAFRFFGSYSPPLYVYLSTIPVWIFGLNEFSIRVVSVIAGSLMVVVVFWYLKQTKLVESKVIPFILILFIITPWNFFFARLGYELYLGFFLFSLGALFCWIGLKRNFFITLGLVILSISTYSSHPQIYSAPIFTLGFLIAFYKYFKKKYLVVGLLVTFLIQLPHILLLNTKAFLNKSDLFYFEEILFSSEKIPLPTILSIPFSFLYSFFARVVTYFSPKSLFFFTDPDLQRSMPEVSVFYNWMVIPYLIGVFIFLKSRKDKFIIFLTLLMIAILIPASLTKDPFSTQRVLGLLLPFFIIICIGISIIYKKIRSDKFITLFFIILSISLIILLRSYFVLLPSERAKNWNYGFKQLASFISKNQDSQFVIDQISGKPVYIEMAFFLKTDPEVLQNASDKSIRHDYYNLNEFNPEYKFENLDIRNIIWEKDIYRSQIIIGDELTISDHQAKEHFLTEVLSIHDPRGYIIFKGYQTNPQKKCQETDFKSDYCKKLN